jgi:hypothetical protein
MKTGTQRKPINYSYYETRSPEYIQGEIAHTERSERAFKRDGNIEEENDRHQHAQQLWKIYRQKTATT